MPEVEHPFHLLRDRLVANVEDAVLARLFDGCADVLVIFVAGEFAQAEDGLHAGGHGQDRALVVDQKGFRVP